MVTQYTCKKSTGLQSAFVAHCVGSKWLVPIKGELEELKSTIIISLPSRTQS